MLKSLSFHPKLVAVLDVVLNVVMLWWLLQINSWWFAGAWLLFRVVIWFILIRLVYYPLELSRWRHLLSLAILSVGALAFLLFIEWQFAWYAVGILFVFFSFFSFWLLPSAQISLSSVVKPHSRWRFMMSIFGLAGIFQGIGAAISFQLIYNVSVWAWLVLAASLATFVAAWWWWEYSIPFSKRFWTRVLLWFILMLELLWVLQILPLGYLASGLALIWCWYILWLLVRFNLTPEGIIWKRQYLFLGINAVLFASFLLFVVRWK